MNIRPVFENQNVYHVYNRGVAKQPIFSDHLDYQHLLTTFGYYLEKNPLCRLSHLDEKQMNLVLKTVSKDPLIEILAYCLMPNHFHLLIKQIADHGVTDFMRLSLNSYTKYFNTRNKRVGPIFQGVFRALKVDSNEQLLHLGRYIYLNPYVSGISDSIEDYPWSSFHLTCQNKVTRICNPKTINTIIGSTNRFEEFVRDYASYARSIEFHKKCLID